MKAHRCRPRTAARQAATWFDREKQMRRAALRRVGENRKVRAPGVHVLIAIGEEHVNGNGVRCGWIAGNARTASLQLWTRRIVRIETVAHETAAARIVHIGLSP